jgi:hypothetical protein
MCTQEASALTTPDNMLTNLRALAQSRRMRGDNRLTIRPVPDAQEQFAPPDEFTGDDGQGLVLEPRDGAPFETCGLAPYRGRAQISAFCDGTRSTYFVGFEDVYPLLYAQNAAVVRARDSSTGYHSLFARLQRQRSTLLSPFGLFPDVIRGVYDQLGLCPTRYADLCWNPADDDDEGVRPSDMLAMGSLAWQGRARRRARRLLDLSEQIVTLAGARLVREQDQNRQRWLLKDGSLFQFDKKYLRQRDDLQNVVACVKTHPVPFFGVSGERSIAQLAIGERSVAFLPRPIREVRQLRPSTLATTARPMISWYLRVREANPQNPSALSGVIRLDMAATDDWREWVDDVSWAVLDEFYGLSSMPDPRYDVMPYGIYDCEQFLKAQQIPGELLLAQLG